ncbi:CelD/BcsL family acetyltransferase involved in cellulose biosynthesis [Mesorhizobium sp. J18]|uniref:GNAT family N-acetyltransferase n=1 Tax=Mesorhizobium sp. J18 TaxID=935263 RepID=UPI00119C557D|nr:GNAT family N-acetyltransferase [Mesorhizobium sp. J18]TWG96728.1 CelD/BcsL family acetyltransferase involved in cellulose biosynthesis [Mesorhizobium sp. J18]
MSYISGLKMEPLVASKAADAVTVTIATTFEAVEKLRPAWHSLPVAEIDSDIDYFLTVVRNAEQILAPHVIHIRRPGRRDLMAVARLENLPVSFRFGYSIFGRATFRAIVLAFGGILGAESREDENLVIRHLLASLEKGAADLILMRNVLVDSSLYAAFIESVSPFRRANGQPMARRWIASIPDSFDTFLSTRSAKTRGNLRRHERQLLKDYGDRLRLQRFERPEELPDLLGDMETVASRTYQRGMGVGFMGSALDKGLMKLGLEKGWYKAWMLYLDERPVAFWTGMAYGDTFFIGTPGFDPEYTKDSVGRFTMLKMIGDLCANLDISRLDYGHGDAEYKAAFGHSAGFDCDVLIGSPRPRTILVLMAYSALSLLNNRAKHFIEETSWGRRLKTALRRSHARKTRPS